MNGSALFGVRAFVYRGRFFPHATQQRYGITASGNACNLAQPENRLGGCHLEMTGRTNLLFQQLMKPFQNEGEVNQQLARAQRLAEVGGDHMHFIAQRKDNLTRHLDFAGIDNHWRVFQRWVHLFGGFKAVYRLFIFYLPNALCPYCPQALEVRLVRLLCDNLCLHRVFQLFPEV
ncbi:hypothetical protein HRbin16_02905 [bacterium HR16]|nr:hypothetical protein HRbin16_02905 [bacterium HR16]